MKGLVLAGGQSRRFGRDKAFAVLPSGETFSERAFRVLSESVGETWISGRDDQQFQFTPRVLVDDGVEGPSAGLRAAARQMPDEYWFVLACDYTQADVACVSFLIEEWSRERGGASSLVFSSGELYEPLLGIWSPQALRMFLSESPLPSPQQVLRKSGARSVACPEPCWLTNRNTPA